jgi:DNA-binding transcriptional MerR regulator
VSAIPQFLNPSEAAKRLGVSAKALRLYERRGLIAPIRTSAGWRAYGPADMMRASTIVQLRALGLSLAEVACVLASDARAIEAALALHQATLEGRVRQLADTIGRVRRMLVNLRGGEVPVAAELSRLLDPAPNPAPGPSIVFDLPWPWGGEPFELRDIGALNHIVGPLGSGKTRLAKRIAEVVPGAVFLGVDRLKGGAAVAQARLDADADLKSRVDRMLGRLVEDGATVSQPLVVLLAELAADEPAILVIDMLEEGLDAATQKALIAFLRRRGPEAKPLFHLTRSSVILDLDCVGADETIIFCPANHSPPIRVAPYPGAPGYEALATCLAPPEVRARTHGVIAWRPKVA